MPTLRPVSFDYFNEWRISNYLLSLFTLPQFVYDLLCLSCPDLIICVVFPFTNCVPLTSVCQTFWRSLEPSGRPKKKEPSTFSTSYSVEPLRPWEVRTHRHMHSQTSTLSVQIDFFLVFFLTICSCTVCVAELLLGGADQYRFLCGGSIPVPGQSDAENFTQTMDSMSIMGFTQEECTCKYKKQRLFTNPLWII